MSVAPTPIADTVADDVQRATPVPATGERVGRYLVLRQLGAGGMGVVLEAHDAVLDRAVALKLLHRTSEPEAEKRLLREGQALARSSHPNVVAVLDVGRHGDRVFVAMERVSGRTLAEWLRETPRSWQEVMSVFAAAARGLAAAHAVGLVHRDFKPHNVMIDDEGRVRVMDFGLARAPGVSSAPGRETTADGDLLASGLTSDGVIVGTPAYMAPEQHAAASADARADQFAWCVALFEALYGHFPFAGATPLQVATAKLEGRVREPASARGVPPWVRPILLRGLSPQASDRFGSMDALVFALDGASKRARRRRIVVGATAAVAATLALALALDDRTSARCRGGADELASVWSAARDRTIGDAMRDTAVIYAESAWSRARSELDRWAATWTATHRAACEAAASAAVSSGRLDAQMACLDERLHELDALLGALERPSPRMVAAVVYSVSSLSDPASCAEPDSVAVANDPATAARVADLRNRLAEARGLLVAGRYEDADARIETLRHGAEAPAVAAELDLAHARVRAMFGDSETAVAAFERAYFAAAVDGPEAVATDAAIRLVDELGYRLGHTDEAMRWAEHAGARLGEDNPRRAQLEGNLGNAWLGAGRPDRAAEHYRNAAALAEGAGEAGALEHVSSLGNIGLALIHSGAPSEALPLLERTEVGLEQLLGPTHPDLARALTNTAGALIELNRLDEAVARVERAIEIDRGAGSPAVQRALSFNALGIIRSEQGRHEDAAAAFSEGLALVGEAEGPGLRERISLSMNLAKELHALGRAQEAGPLINRAVALELDAVGPADPGHAITLMVRAHIRLDLGDLRGALGDAERAGELTRNPELHEDASRTAATARERLGE